MKTRPMRLDQYAPQKFTQDPNGGTEYGGVGGIIQPSPHDPADHPAEQLQMIYATDSSDLTGESGNEVPFSDRIA